MNWHDWFWRPPIPPLTDQTAKQNCLQRKPNWSAIRTGCLALAVLCASTAFADVCSVPSVPHPSIRAAVDDAACTEIVLAARVFAESVGLADFTRVAMAIRAVLSFHECGVDVVAHRGSSQCLLDAVAIAEHHVVIDLDHALLVAGLVNRRIRQVRRWHLIRRFGPAGPAGVGRDHLFAVYIQNRAWL